MLASTKFFFLEETIGLIKMPLPMKVGAQGSAQTNLISDGGSSYELFANSICRVQRVTLRPVQTLALLQ